MKNTVNKVIMAGLLLLLTVTCVPSLNIPARVEAQSAPGVVEFPVSVRGTYLHAEPYTEDFPTGAKPIDPPAIVDLQAHGLTEGDGIFIIFKGEIDSGDALWHPEYPVIYRQVSKLNGVFSTNDDLGPISDRHRVPGAIDAGEDQDSGLTYFNNEPIDIPEDFAIEAAGLWIEVPRNARYLFICFVDSFYPDNTGSITATIEKDSDGDGLLDSWEISGIDSDNDGTIDLHLPMLGADWEHKDVFVEADYMSGQAPRQDAIGDVVEAFADAPVSNPDGVEGINLHVIIDESVPALGLLNSFDEYYILKASQFGTPDERSNPEAIEAKKLAFRYCMFVNRIWPDAPDHGCPGIAEGVPCDDFILAFGAFEDGGSREDQAAVFMHELGHALGLHHGGNTGVNYKPNYLSIMNYAFQFNTWKPDRPLDYSDGLCSDLDEAALDEALGVGYSTVTVWRGPAGELLRNNQGLVINWDNDAVEDAAARVNLNHNPGLGHPSEPDQVLEDYNDWAKLVYRFRGTRLSVASATLEDYHVELTTDQIEQMRQEALDSFGAPAPEPGKTSSGLPAAVYAVIAVAAVAMVAAAVWLLRRRSQAPAK